MAKYVRALVALLAVLLLTPAFSAEKFFQWKNPGGDPCNPKAGCTLEWALGKAGWPAEVRNILTVAVTGEVPKPYSVESGWKGWMTWGKYSAKFQPNTVAHWPKGHTEPARLWSTSYDGRQYNLVRVTKCGNWGGWTEEAPKSKPVPASPVVNAEPIAPPTADLMPLGPRFIAGCE